MFADPYHEFEPNNGDRVIERKIDEYPIMAQTIMIHLAEEHRKELCLVLSLEEARKMCHLEKMKLHVSEMFIRDKQDTPNSRLFV